VPYPNLPEDQWGEMDRCVEDVMAKQGLEKERAIAICYQSISGKSEKGRDESIEHLTQAIDLHRDHMNGAKPTDEASQQELMDHIEMALAELSESAKQHGGEHAGHSGAHSESPKTSS